MSDKVFSGSGSGKWTHAELQQAIHWLKQFGIRAVVRNGILVDGSRIKEIRKMPMREKLRRTALMSAALPRREETPEEIAELEEIRARWVRLNEAYKRRS